VNRLPLLGALAAVVLALAYFFLLYEPRTVEQEALEAETLALQGQQGTLQADIAALEQVRDNRGRIEADLLRLRQLIPDDTAQPVTLQDLQQLAGDAAIAITSLTFAEPRPVDPVVELGADRQLGVIDTTMTFQGPYFEAVDFVRRLEQEGERALLIRTLGVAEGEDGFPQLVTTVTGQYFTTLPASAGAAVPAPPPGGNGGDVVSMGP
jgi:hypothetical protein